MKHCLSLCVCARVCMCLCNSQGMFFHLFFLWIQVCWCLRARGLCQFLKVSLIDKQSHPLQAKKNGSLSVWPMTDWHFSAPFVAQSALYVHRDSGRLKWGKTELGFKKIYPRRMIFIDMLRFSVAAARGYRWKEPLQAISNSVIREVCAGYWRLLCTTQYSVPKLTANI